LTKQHDKTPIMTHRSSVLWNKEHWDELARVDSFWAILSDPQKKSGKWDLQDFLATGEVEIAWLMREIAELGYSLTSNRALDFGCGVGRLTRQIAKHFDQCIGVDISDEMIRQAREINSDQQRCEFILNISAGLEQFPANMFDLVYTSIVLQHVPNEAAILNYVAEFIRILRPGGLLVMQVPCVISLRRRLQLRRRLYVFLRSVGVRESLLYRYLNLTPMRMNCVPEGRMIAFLNRLHATVLKVEDDSRAGPGIESRTYFVTAPI
jgi:ubiquinone/menaquinone biosynthesis C-methylase UbiE